MGSPIEIVEFVHHGVKYDIRSRCGEVTGKRIYSVPGRDTWHGSPEMAVKHYLSDMKAAETGYYCAKEGKKK